MKEKKVYKLELDEVPRQPFLLVGIAATLKYYSLCHHLNKIWSTDFMLTTPLKIKIKDKQVEFVCLEASIELSEQTLAFFSNKEGGNFLLPEASNYDFILQVFGALDSAAKSDYLKKIQDVKGVIIAAELPKDKMKHIKRLERPK